MEDLLKIGTKIEIGRSYANNSRFEEGEVIELIEGSFEEDNGLYITTSTAPSVFNPQLNEFDSIYHLFGNDLDEFDDCKIISKS